MGDSQSCQNHTQKRQLPSGSGFLSSITYREKQIGTELCPWYASAKPGQNIEIVFYDFNLDETLSLTNQGGSCPATFYAVEENGEVKTANICDVVAVSRQKTIYVSEGSSLTFYLEITGTFQQEPFFLLKYQGRHLLLFKRMC